jgi:PKD repeat protein
MKINLNKIALFAVAAATTLVSCNKEETTPAPTVGIDYTTDELSVTFTTVGKNVDTYAWDFGDDSTSTEANPVHTYPYSGTFTVELTVTGKGGAKTVEVEVEVSDSKLDLLTGGAEATNGKTWVFSTTVTAEDGVYPVGYPLGTKLAPTFDNILAMGGIESEYDNEFTFYNDGTYKIDNVNGISLAGVMYGVYHEEDVVAVVGDLILSTVNYTVPENATFSFGTESFNLDVRQEDISASPTVVSDPATLSFTDVLTLNFSAGAYFGILDFNTKIIVDKLSADKLEILVLASTLRPTTYPDDFAKPSVMVRMTMVPKE